MHFAHPEHPGRSVRLAYCMNLHAAETLVELLEGVREFTLPLRDRFAGSGSFGVGMYFPAELARHLASASGERELASLREELSAARLTPFTFNAFPFGGFHHAGLKQQVFEPTWCSAERVAFTLDVAQLAATLGQGEEDFITISTHPGRFGPWAAGEFELAAEHIAQVLRSFAQVREQGGPQIMLALEAEPRAVAGTTPELAALLAKLTQHLRTSLGTELLRAHLGICLDACHSAVEFEAPARAAALALSAGFGKLQFSSAIALHRPAEHPAARAALQALDEPRYLHQTTGRLAADAHLLRVDDLPELQRHDQPGSPWLECEQWRTHFHVPVDLERFGDEGLETTRAHADAILDALLAAPQEWGRAELQVEIETYTWNILPSPARGVGELRDGLAREYSHVIERLSRAGWSRSRTN